MLLDFTCSIVLYQNDLTLLKLAVDSVLQTSLSFRIYLVDNSPDDRLREVATDDRIEYIFNNRNIGFGAAHNIAIEICKPLSAYHLILNPDIEFGPDTIEKIFVYMEQHPQVGQLLPKVLYLDGQIQRLCKLLPTPYDLIGRRFLSNKLTGSRNHRYELGMFSYDFRLNVPNLSGCFMFLRNSVLEKVGGFDPRYFMYLEDIDLTRRIHAVAETIFFPDVAVYHGYAKGSYVNKNLLKYHIASAIKYFNKWGWFFDKQRGQFNKAVLKTLTR